MNASFISFAAVTLGLATTTPAQSATDGDATGPYVGVNVGRATADFGRAHDAFRSSLASPTAAGADKNDTGWRVFSGYRVTPHFGLELGYADLGDFRASSRGSSVGRLSSAVDGKALTLDALGHVPLGNGFEAFARGGVAYTRTRATAQLADGATLAAGESGTHKHNEFNPRFGAGLEYSLSRDLTLRAEAERTLNVGNASTGQSHVTLISLGLAHRI